LRHIDSLAQLNPRSLMSPAGQASEQTPIAIMDSTPKQG
jgi:hypothetical protein